jgi:drug/metabolite transporter (DMT)-like permease
VAIIAGLTSMLFWGAGDFVAAVLSRRIGPIRTLLWTTIFGDLVVITYALITGALSDFTLTAFFFALAGGLLHTIGTLSFYKGLREGKVSLVAPISSGWSLILVLGGVLLYGEVLTATQISAVIFVIIGTILVSADFRELFTSSKVRFSDPGIPYAFITLFSWGIGLLFFNEAVKQVGWVIPNIILASSIIFFLVVYSVSSKQSLSPPVSKNDWLRAIFIGFAAIAAYISYSIGIEKYPTSLVGPLAAACPLVTVVLASLILREKTVFNQKLGMLSVIAGAILLSVK